MLNLTKRGLDRLGPFLSIYTRETFEAGLEPPVLDTTNVEELAARYRDTPIPQKIDKLLRLAAARTSFPGKLAAFSPEWDYPLIHAVDAEEALYYRAALVNRGLLETAGDSVKITLAGWEALGPMSGHGIPGRCFVAMSFHASLDAAYNDGIKPGIEDAGYDAVRVDKVHHNEKICDRIIVEIKQAQFVVADVTLQRQGVYFEAGYAMGLGRPVIWSCRKDDLANAHFDTRQYSHVVWPDAATLRTMLSERIQATIGQRVR